MATLEAVFAQIDQRLATHPTTIGGYSAHYAFVFDGERHYHIVIDNGRAEVGVGAITTAQMTVSMSSEDFIALAQGKYDSNQVIDAVQNGRITIQGDLTLADLLSDFLKE